MSHYNTGYEKGRAAGAALKGTNDHDTTRSRDLKFVRQLFPDLGDIDIIATVRDYDRERLAAQPDLAKFPELRGRADFLRGERVGFRDASGLDESATALHFSLNHWWMKRVNSRHVARWDLLTINPNGCTNVFIPDGAEGVTISDNRDIALVKDNPKWFADWWPKHVVESNRREVNWTQGGVSAALLLDEEPQNIFPCNPHEILPDECRNDIGAIKEFLTRYAEFWGPCKQIWVDRKLNAVGVEKTNRRVGFIDPDPKTGAVAVTACSYITPELAELRDERLRKVAEHKNETWDDSLDRQYCHGADRRQHRLLELTFAESRRVGGATIWGALDVVADHAVPYPDRVCLAGETCSPQRQPNPEWSVIQHAAVISGDRRRMLYRAIEDMNHPKAVYDCTPKLKLGECVAMLPEWRADLDAGRCILS